MKLEDEQQTTTEKMVQREILPGIYYYRLDGVFTLSKLTRVPSETDGMRKFVILGASGP